MPIPIEIFFLGIVSGVPTLQIRGSKKLCTQPLIPDFSMAGEETWKELYNKYGIKQKSSHRKIFLAALIMAFVVMTIFFMISSSNLLNHSSENTANAPSTPANNMSSNYPSADNASSNLNLSKPLETNASASQESAQQETPSSSSGAPSNLIQP